MEKQDFWQFSVSTIITLALLFIVPLLVNKTHMFPFTTGKSLVVIMGAMLAAVFYLWGKMRDNVVSTTPIKIILALFSGILVLSSVYALVPHLSFFGNFEGMSAFLILSAIVFAVVVGGLLKKGALKMGYVLWTSIISAMFVTVSVWSGVLSNNANDAGYLGNSSYAGAYLLINVFFALALLIGKRDLWQKVLAVISLGAIIFSPILFNVQIFKGAISLKDILANPTLLGGVANGAVVGIVVGIVTVIGLFLVRSKKRSYSIFGAVLVLALFAGLWALGQSLMNPHSKIHTAYVAEKNANRFVFWDIADAGAHERPLLGWGINGYIYAYQEYFDPIIFSPGHATEVWVNNPHNMFKEYAVNTGLFGMALYVVLIGATGIALFRASRNESQKVISITLFGAFTGYVVQNLFVFDTAAPLLLFYVIVGYAISQEKAYTVIVSEKMQWLKHGALGIGIVVCAYVFWIAGVLPWRESHAQAIRIISDTVAETQSTQRMSGFSYAGDSSFFGGKVVGALRGNLKELPNDKKALVTKHVQKVIEEIEIDIAEDGVDNFRAEWVLAQLYLKQIELTMVVTPELSAKAQEHFDKAFAINANNPVLYFDRAQGYAFEKDYKSAQKWIRAGIAMQPRYTLGYKYAQQLIDKKLATADFGQYVKEMRDRWCSDPTSCIEK